MLGTPPGGSAPGTPPGGPPMPPPPGMMAGLGGPPPGMPPGLPPMAPRPPLGGPTSLGSNSPLGSLFTDLSADMSPGWQIVDASVRGLKLARKTADLQETPKVVAVLSQMIENLTTLISHYTHGKSGVPTGMTQESGGVDAESESNPSPDAAGEPDTMDSTAS